MLDHLSPAQRALADYMSILSEVAYQAAWMGDLELALWKAVVLGPYTYGRLQFTEEHVERLRMLSEQCGGWVRFQDEGEETFVPLADWKAYAANAF